MRTQNKWRPIAHLAIAAAVSFSLALSACGDGSPGGGGRTDPEITGFTFTATNGLRETNANAAVDAVAGTFSAPEGGTAPFTYAVTGGTDSANFTVEGTSLKVKDSALTEKTYSVNARITDSKGKTLVKALTFTVLAANDPYPEITDFSFTQSAFTTGEGTVGATVGTFSNPVGGTAPFTYSITSGTDQGNFDVDGTSLKVKTSALTEKSSPGYTVEVTITDSASPAKTYQKTLDIPIYDTNTLRGTVTFTGIGTQSTQSISSVYISAEAGSGTVTLGAVTNGTANGTWAIPLDQPFTGSKSVQFRLTINFSGGSSTNKFVRKPVDVSNLSNIDLGQISAATITLSGTISVKVNGSAPNVVAIQARANGDQVGYTALRSPSGVNDAWSITIPAFDTDTSVTFNVAVSSTIERKNVPGVTVKDTSKSGIVLDLGDISTITLSGNIGNITVDGTPYTPSAPIYISVAAYDGNTLLGEANVESSNTWSITIPALSSSKTVTFKLDVYDDDAEETLVSYYPISGKTATVHDTSVPNIALGNVAVTLKTITITLSGFTGGTQILADRGSYTTVAALLAGVGGQPYAFTYTETATATMRVPADAPALYFYVIDMAGNVYKTASSSSGTSVTLTKGSMTSIGILD